MDPFRQIQTQESFKYSTDHCYPPAMPGRNPQGRTALESHTDNRPNQFPEPRMSYQTYQKHPAYHPPPRPFPETPVYQTMPRSQYNQASYPQQPMMNHNNFRPPNAYYQAPMPVPGPAVYLSQQSYQNIPPTSNPQSMMSYQGSNQPYTQYPAYYNPAPTYERNRGAYPVMQPQPYSSVGNFGSQGPRQEQPRPFREVSKVVPIASPRQEGAMAIRSGADKPQDAREHDSKLETNREFGKGNSSSSATEQDFEHIPAQAGWDWSDNEGHILTPISSNNMSDSEHEDSEIEQPTATAAPERFHWTESFGDFESQDWLFQRWDFGSVIHEILDLAKNRYDGDDFLVTREECEKIRTRVDDHSTAYQRRWLITSDVKKSGYRKMAIESQQAWLPSDTDETNAKKRIENPASKQDYVPILDKQQSCGNAQDSSSVSRDSDEATVRNDDHETEGSVTQTPLQRSKNSNPHPYKVTDRAWPQPNLPENTIPTASYRHPVQPAGAKRRHADYVGKSGSYFEKERSAYIRGQEERFARELAENNAYYIQSEDSQAATTSHEEHFAQGLNTNNASYIQPNDRQPVTQLSQGQVPNQGGVTLTSESHAFSGWSAEPAQVAEPSRATVGTRYSSKRVVGTEQKERIQAQDTARSGIPHIIIEEPQEAQEGSQPEGSWTEPWKDPWSLSTNEHSGWCNKDDDERADEISDEGEKDEEGSDKEGSDDEELDKEESDEEGSDDEFSDTAVDEPEKDRPSEAHSLASDTQLAVEEINRTLTHLYLWFTEEEHATIMDCLCEYLRGFSQPATKRVLEYKLDRHRRMYNNPKASYEDLDFVLLLVEAQGQLQQVKRRQEVNNGRLVVLIVLSIAFIAFITALSHAKGHASWVDTLMGYCLLFIAGGVLGGLFWLAFLPCVYGLLTAMYLWSGAGESLIDYYRSSEMGPFRDLVDECERIQRWVAVFGPMVFKAFAPFWDTQAGKELIRFYRDGIYFLFGPLDERV